MLRAIRAFFCLHIIAGNDYLRGIQWAENCRQENKKINRHLLDFNDDFSRGAKDYLSFIEKQALRNRK